MSFYKVYCVDAYGNAENEKHVLARMDRAIHNDPFISAADAAKLDKAMVNIKAHVIPLLAERDALAAKLDEVNHCLAALG